MNATGRATARWGRLLAGVVAVLLGGSLAACGVGVERSPTELADAADEPIELPQGPTSSVPSTEAAVIYLVRDERLVPVAREVAVDGDLDELLAAVLAGPTAAEADDGLTTAIPEPTAAIDVRRDGSTVSVDLTGDLTSVGGLEEVLAVGQIVLTLADSSDAAAVVFAIDGQPTVVPAGDGALTERPVTPDDYLDLLSP